MKKEADRMNELVEAMEHQFMMAEKNKKKVTK